MGILDQIRQLENRAAASEANRGLDPDEVLETLFDMGQTLPMPEEVKQDREARREGILDIMAIYCGTLLPAMQLVI